MKKPVFRKSALVLSFLVLGLVTLQLRKSQSLKAALSLDTSTTQDADPIQSETLTLDSGASAEIHTGEGHPRNYLSASAPGSTGQKIDLKAIQDVLALDRKVLRTRAEDEAYHAALQDPAKIGLAASALSRIQEPESDESLRLEQSERMDAALFLTRALEWKENPQSPEVKEIVKNLILDEAVAKAKDPRLKKSLAADRIELFANLKSIDAKAAELVQNGAQTESSKKVIRFATNFYRLDEKKVR